MAELEWDQESRDLVLGLDAVKLCRVCGGPAYLCQDPELQDDWRAGDPIRCHATTAQLARQKGVTEQTNPHTQALIWPVSLLDRRGAGG